MNRLRAMICAAFRHSRVLDTFFNYQYCARCGAQVGDTLGGVGVGGPVVGLNFPADCEKCAHDQMTFMDRFLIRKPRP